MAAAVVAAGGIAGCKREPLKAGAGSNAPTVTRPVRMGPPSSQALVKENRAKLLDNFYDLVPLGEGIATTTPDGEWARLKNGMMIHELRPSSDGMPPRLGQTVSVAYVGTFPGTGQVFDQRGPADPLVFRMGTKDLIKGFSMALQELHPGGKRRVYLPAEFAYGAAGKPEGHIPPNQPLIFEIELLSVTGQMIEITADDLPKFEPAGPPAPAKTPAREPASAPATQW